MAIRRASDKVTTQKGAPHGTPFAKKL